jgi:hypothetical protein
MTKALPSLLSISHKETMLMDTIGLESNSFEPHSTIDGFMINPLYKLAALKKGTGVMIGDYFVGVTTGSEITFSNPEIVY